MMKNRVSDPAQALAYIADCTLATVCHLAMKRLRPKYEFDRQVLIAQTAVDWMAEFGVDASSTRAADVLAVGSVEKWAQEYMPEHRK